MISFGLALMVQSDVWCVCFLLLFFWGGGGGGTASDELMLHFPWCWYLLSSTHTYHFGHILRSQWCQKHFGKQLYLFRQVVTRWSSNIVWQLVLKIWTRSCIYRIQGVLLPLMCQQRSYFYSWWFLDVISARCFDLLHDNTSLKTLLICTSHLDLYSRSQMHQKGKGAHCNFWVSFHPLGKFLFNHLSSVWLLRVYSIIWALYDC